jgi:hypothetical protein
MEKIKDMRTLLDDRKSYSTWLLLHFAKRENAPTYRDSIVKDEPVELVITLNGVEMSRVDMDEAMNEITQLHLNELGATEDKLKRDRENFNEIVVKKAEELIKEKMEGLEELLYDVKENLDMVDSLAKNNISWMEK